MPAPRHHEAISIRRSSAAFTLLEVIISMSLVSTLMLLVWSLFSTYTRLEERSSRTAVELQLVRSVSRQLRSDLQHFALLPIPPNVIYQPDGEMLSGDDRSEGDRSTDDSAAGGSGESDESDTETGSEFEQPDANDDDFTEAGSDASDSGSDALATDGLTGGVAPAATASLSVVDESELNASDVFAGNPVNASLPEQTYLRGSARRLELVTRLPYTVDVPPGGKFLSEQTRYGTHHWVVYEFRDPRDLESMLRSDPILNPSRFVQPATPLQTDPLQPPPAPVVPAMLNPNDNVGLIRETKSWLHVTRDQRNNALRKIAEQAGLLVNGALPVDANSQPSLLDRLENRTATSDSKYGNDGDDFAAPWAPPPEFRHRKDHIPEVTRLQFRYFNGESWNLDWSDAEMLPVAVEVAFDLDADAPAVRAKEFEEAHAQMLGGKSISEVLPEDDPEEDELLEDDPLATLNLVDPTAIVTEYRFVILMPKTAGKEDSEEDEGAESQSDVSSNAGTSGESFSVQSQSETLP